MGPTLTDLDAPQPPAFLDPLYSLEDCYYYAVPRFLDIKHPSNRWLVGRIKANDADSIRRKMELTPDLFRNKYFQILDNPSLYFDDKKAGGPMYHSKCVLYLTPLGISLYMKSRDVVELLLTYRDTYGNQLIDASEVQFASHMQNPNDGDFHAFPPFLIAVRREFFAAAEPLQAAGWNPNRELALPIRRRYERRAFYFRDWLDVALHLLSNRSFYPIHLLVSGVIGAPNYRPSMLPLALFRPGRRDPPATPVGLVDVGDLPPGLGLIGAYNLLEMAEKYDQYLQLQQTMKAVQALKREAESDGVNPEWISQQAQDPLEPPLNLPQEAGADAPVMPQTSNYNVNSWCRSPNWTNRNNSARSDRIRSKSQTANLPPSRYCSESLRILLFSLEKDKRCKSLQQCIDAFNVYARWNHFVNADRLTGNSPRARDQRNVINCLLNVARREQDRIDDILDRIRSGKRRFAHVEEHKALENRRMQHSNSIERVVGCLAQVVLQSKEIVAFLHSTRFPIYSKNAVDYQAVPNVNFILPSVRFGVVRHFNDTRRAWRYLTEDMLKAVAKDPALTLHLRVGNRPSRANVLAYTNQLQKAEKKQKMENERQLAKKSTA